MNIALYARVSRADKDQRPENQLLKLRAYALDHGYTVFSEYVDYASGATPERPELERMRGDARANRFGVILTTRIDRIGRSVAHFSNLIAELDESGVTLVATDQPINTSSSTGRFLRTVLSAFAELELDMIRERTKDGLARARAEGKILGRPADLERTASILSARRAQKSIATIARELGTTPGAVKQCLRRVRNRDAKSPSDLPEMKGATETDDSVPGDCRSPPR